MPQHEKIGVAVVGAGFICDYHVTGIRAAGTGEVTTLVGRSQGRTALKAAELRAQREAQLRQGVT